MYQQAYKDIKDSGLCPNGLVSIDQSIDLTKVSTVTAEEIEGVVKSSVTKSSSSSTSESSSNFDSDYESSSVTTSSSTTSTTVETSSTVEFTLDSSYTIQYEYGTYDLFGKYNILKDLKPEIVRYSIFFYVYIILSFLLGHGQVTYNVTTNFRSDKLCPDNISLTTLRPSAIKTCPMRESVF